MTNPTPAVPELIAPSNWPVSPSKRAVRCSRTSLSQNQCGPGRSGSVTTLPTVSHSARAMPRPPPARQMRSAPSIPVRAARLCIVASAEPRTAAYTTGEPRRARRWGGDG